MSPRWMVVRVCDGGPPELYPFEDEADAREFYGRASLQWSDCWLTRVVAPIRGHESLGAVVVAHPASTAAAAQAVADAAALLVDDWRLDVVQRERLQQGLQLALLRLGGG